MAVINPIAYIENDFTEKFGIPRQSGLTSCRSRIVFLPEYRDPEALRGIAGFSHIWLLWQFDKAQTTGKKWSPTVRPPRLGGNKRMGVFAPRSPYRPNSIGLSSVRLEEIDYDTPEGAVLIVTGADILSSTPIIDIKPYLPYTDCHPEATGGFSLSDREILQVDFPEDLRGNIPARKLSEISELLSQDPRPQYQDDPERIYTMAFGGYDISFAVKEGVLTVTGAVYKGT